MTVLVDNYDSFTYNIVQYIRELGHDLHIIRNDDLDIEGLKALEPTKLILSPGPCTPNEAGICLEAIEVFQDDCPMLGICLGHQSIAQAFGAQVVQATNMMHGKTSRVEVVKHDMLFEGIAQTFEATRYHSLVVCQKDLPDAIVPLAYSKDDQEIMALRIQDKPIYGLQYHPESILSEYGKTILDNFMHL